MELTEKERNLIYIEIDKNIEKLKKIETVQAKLRLRLSLNGFYIQKINKTVTQDNLVGKSKLKLYYFSNVVLNRLLKIYIQKKQNQLKIIGDLNKQTYYKID